MQHISFANRKRTFEKFHGGLRFETLTDFGDRNLDYEQRGRKKPRKRRRKSTPRQRKLEALGRPQKQIWIPFPKQDDEEEEEDEENYPPKPPGGNEVLALLHYYNDAYVSDEIRKMMDLTLEALQKLLLQGDLTDDEWIFYYGRIRDILLGFYKNQDANAEELGVFFDLTQGAIDTVEKGGDLVGNIETELGGKPSDRGEIAKKDEEGAPWFDVKSILGLTTLVSDVASSLEAMLADAIREVPARPEDDDPFEDDQDDDNDQGGGGGDDDDDDDDQGGDDDDDQGDEEVWFRPGYTEPYRGFFGDNRYSFVTGRTKDRQKALEERIKQKEASTEWTPPLLLTAEGVGAASTSPDSKEEKKEDIGGGRELRPKPTPEPTMVEPSDASLTGAVTFIQTTMKDAEEGLTKEDAIALQNQQTQ